VVDAPGGWGMPAHCRREVVGGSDTAAFGISGAAVALPNGIAACGVKAQSMQ
jgi:hypothetical protein